MVLLYTSAKYMFLAKFITKISFKTCQELTLFDRKKVEARKIARSNVINVYSKVRLYLTWNR